MSETSKLCVDCEHYRWNSDHLCNGPDTAITELIIGQRRFIHCVFARSKNGACGPEGKHWQAKEEPFAGLERTCATCGHDGKSHPCPLCLPVLDPCGPHMPSHWMDGRKEPKEKACVIAELEEFKSDAQKEIAALKKALANKGRSPAKPKKEGTYAIPASILRKLWNSGHTAWNELEEYRPAGGF